MRSDSGLAGPLISCLSLAAPFLYTVPCVNGTVCQIIPLPFSFSNLLLLFSRIDSFLRVGNNFSKDNTFCIDGSYLLRC